MSRLDLARGRLTTALENLEKNAKRAAQSPVLDKAQTARIADLEGERERLLARVAELEEELAALTSLTSEVEGRLDGAIGEIRAALSR